MKPTDGKYQTATQVKVLSPEIFNVGIGRQFPFTGRQQRGYRNGEIFSPPRGLRPWYGIERKLQELGRSYWLYDRCGRGDLSLAGVNTHLTPEIVEGNNPKRGGTSKADRKSDYPIVVKKRGNACGAKGITLLCKGLGTDCPDVEQEEQWKRN